MEHMLFARGADTLYSIMPIIPAGTAATLTQLQAQ